ncbi:Oidioi.mRNA.OKI2018_I69.XSR.g16238.t1.cds [Oikopleura dioica]|uniref:Oidioi.mRNA.OKI2018_I69.XSR.g16238.t1.cds n=1 Tax=Oikopleura dioica TaxID=34765 RepID=A0ABN7SMT1_OIKDI|nr:Oidioi.mRNA.OKI2018_I69.XSR.g16238.t1.cds [Oikopleura dioica]
MLLLFLPMNIHKNLKKEWVFGKLACSINNSVKFVNMFVSIFMLMLMAVDSFPLLILFLMYKIPFEHRLSKYRNNPLVIGITCLLVWLFGFLAAYPNFIRSEFLYENGQAECGINWWGKNRTLKEEAAKCGPDANINGSNVMTGWRCRCGMTPEERTYNMHLFGWTFILPLTCIVFSYSNIGYVIWKSSERTRSFSMTRADSRRSANTRTKRLMILIVTLIVVYIVCWTPYHLFHLLVYCGVKLDHNPCSIFEHVYNTLIWSNSAVNPILYSFLGHGFKQKLYEVWKKIKRSWLCIRLVSMREHRTNYFGENEHLVFTPSTTVPSYHHMIGKTNVVSLGYGRSFLKII